MQKKKIDQESGLSALNNPLVVNHSSYKTTGDVEKVIDTTVTIMDKELRDGLKFMSKFPKSVSFFGSARFTPEHPYYQKTKHMAKRIVSELGYAVVTGGGGGIMDAANHGAYEGGGNSLGILIRLPKEQKTNPYLTDYMEFNYFYSRKLCLYYSAEAYILFPGGFGTMDEFFEIVTLIQTKKIPKVPVILFGKEYWNGVVGMIKKNLLEDNKAINADDLNIFKITEDENEILEIVRKAPLR